MECRKLVEESYLREITTCVLSFFHAVSVTLRTMYFYGENGVKISNLSENNECMDCFKTVNLRSLPVYLIFPKFLTSSVRNP